MGDISTKAEQLKERLVMKYFTETFPWETPPTKPSTKSARWWCHAIVAELGVDEDMVKRLRRTAWYFIHDGHHRRAAETNAAADALSHLLEASK